MAMYVVLKFDRTFTNCSSLEEVYDALVDACEKWVQQPFYFTTTPGETVEETAKDLIEFCLEENGFGDIAEVVEKTQKFDQMDIVLPQNVEAFYALRRQKEARKEAAERRKME